MPASCRIACQLNRYLSPGRGRVPVLSLCYTPRPMDPDTPIPLSKVRLTRADFAWMPRAAWRGLVSFVTNTASLALGIAVIAAVALVLAAVVKWAWITVIH